VYISWLLVSLFVFFFMSWRIGGLMLLWWLIH
jgi:hypothetical protein